MAKGIIQSQVKPQPNAQPDDQQDDQQDEEDQQGAPAAAAQPGAAQPKADPVVTRIHVAAKKVLSQPQVAQHVIMLIKQSANNPAQGIAKATIFVLQMVFSQAKGVPAQSIPPAIAAVAIDVARTGAVAKLYKLTPQIAKQGALVALQMYRQRVQQKQQQGAQQPPAQPPAQPAAPAAPAPAPAGGMAPAPQPQPVG